MSAFQYQLFRYLIIVNGITYDETKLKCVQPSLNGFYEEASLVNSNVDKQ